MDGAVFGYGLQRFKQTRLGFFLGLRCLRRKIQFGIFLRSTLLQLIFLLGFTRRLADIQCISIAISSMSYFIIFFSFFSNLYFLFLFFFLFCWSCLHDFLNLQMLICRVFFQLFRIIENKRTWSPKTRDGTKPATSWCWWWRLLVPVV